MHTRGVTPEIRIAVECLLHGQRACVDLQLSPPRHHHFVHHLVVQVVVHALRVYEHVLRLARAEDLLLSSPRGRHDGRRSLLSQPRQGELRHGHLTLRGNALEHRERLEQLFLTARFPMAAELRA